MYYTLGWFSKKSSLQQKEQQPHLGWKWSIWIPSLFTGCCCCSHRDKAYEADWYCVKKYGWFLTAFGTKLKFQICFSSADIEIYFSKVKKISRWRILIYQTPAACQPTNQAASRNRNKVKKGGENDGPTDRLASCTAPMYTHTLKTPTAQL